MENRIKKLLIDINEQATRHTRGSDEKELLITDFEIITEKVQQLIQILKLEVNNTIDQPYIETINIEVCKEYNPEFGDDRICECGHQYYRHFDSYENNDPVGCKYCGCYDFKEKLL